MESSANRGRTQIGPLETGCATRFHAVSCATTPRSCLRLSGLTAAARSVFRTMRVVVTSPKHSSDPRASDEAEAARYALNDAGHA